MMEALHFSEWSILRRATKRNIPEDDIFHSHRSENLKSYILFSSFLEFLAMDKVQNPE
jgi:hypothetical protein